MIKSKFQGKNAVVYLHDMTKKFGGCERSGLAFAKAFSLLGFNVEVVTMTRPAPSKERVAQYFGDEFDDIEIYYREPREDGKWPGEIPFLFVNFSHANYMANPSPLGIYRLMFPVYSLLKENAPQDVENLCTYNLMLSNSSFTKQYADLMWDYPTERSHILNSPIRASIAAMGDSFVQDFPNKKKRFVNIGRIESYKNQQLLIDAFMDARSQHPILEEWELILVGGVSSSEASRNYFNGCLKAAEQSDGAISIEQDVSHDRLVELLMGSFGYVHGMGAFLPPGEKPHLCEHFGQTIIEAMAHGCLPIVYGRGGIFDVLNVDHGGVPYLTYEGLLEGFVEIAELWGRPEVVNVQKKMIKGALAVRFERFTEHLGEIIEKEIVS